MEGTRSGSEGQSAGPRTLPGGSDLGGQQGLGEWEVCVRLLSRAWASLTGGDGLQVSEGHVLWVLPCGCSGAWGGHIPTRDSAWGGAHAGLIFHFPFLSLHLLLGCIVFVILYLTTEYF